MFTNHHKVRSVCPYCGVGCGILMEVSDGRVVKVSGDKSHPSNLGRLCTKGGTCAQPLESSGRLEQAYLRDGRERQPARVPVLDAIRESARRLSAVIDTHGPDAVALYVSGQMSLEAQYLANKLAKGFIGTNNIESNSRLCMASAGSGYKLSLGSDAPPGSYDDFDHADLFFVIGANMADCHPILFLRMMDRVKAGAKLIVVDPRRNATAEKAHLFLQIRPGTDLALLNGLLHLIVANGRTDPQFIAGLTEGWEAMPPFLEDYPAGKVAEITGLAEADIRQAAAWIGDAKAWMSCWTMGLNQSTHGTWNTNALCNLHLATGAICKPGSGPFSLTGQPNAMGGREMGYMGPGLPGQRSVLVEADRELVERRWKIAPGTLRTTIGGGTVAMFEDMRAGKIKACWIICTNPVATVPNRRTVIEALEAAELVITQDAFLDTETNRYADILLPGALWAEAEGVMINSERNLTLMQPAVPPPGEALPDWQIIARIACEMGHAEHFTYASAAEVFEEIKQFWNPTTGYDLRGASYERLRETPLQWPCAPGGAPRNPIRYLNDGASQRLLFATPSGKAQFLPRPHLPPAEMPDGDFPWVLNTGRLQHQWHTLTKTGKVAALNKLNPGPFVEIHPEDATTLRIAAGDAVEVRSRRGRAVLPAVVTERVRPGNCFAPFHWNDVFGDDLAINAVTSDATDPISQQPEFKFSAVALTRVAAPDAASKPPGDTADADETNVHASIDAGACSYDTEPHEMTQIDVLAKLLGLERIPPLDLTADEQFYMGGYLTALRTDVARRSGGIPVLPPTAPFDRHRRLMLDGILAGLFARTRLPLALPDAMPQPPALAPAAARAAPITILWASQTGNAESFAKHCSERFERDGHTARLASMDTVSPEGLTGTGRVLLLTSTFGDGDPPDNARAFWKALEADSAPRLPDTEFAVLAFGDSSYGQFCGFGRRLDARLEALGARRLAARVDCEPEFEASAKAWLDGVAAAWTSERKVSAGEHRYSRREPLLSRAVVNRILNLEGAGKETRQLVLEITDTALTYEAGDALGIWPTQCPRLVDELLTALDLDASYPVMLDEHGELPLAEALMRHCEITTISPDMLRFVCDRARAGLLQELLAAGREEDLSQWLRGRQLIDLLQAYPIPGSDAGDFLRVLKRLQPRLYSISSSPKAHPGHIHLTVSIARYTCDGQSRGGACSTFLADRSRDAAVPIFVQKSPHFRPPRDPDTPMIMVGPGTGIAPFRAFLQERRESGARGRNWLFFGEQHEVTDFYYRQELQKMQHDGLLTRLSVAFSRDQADKVYVQHRMRERGRELWAWLQEGAHFYVCGDATRMARDVDAALRQVAEHHGGLSASGADDFVERLRVEKRYVRDVY